MRLLLSILHWSDLKLWPGRLLGGVTTSLQVLGAQGLPRVARCPQMLADTLGCGRC